MNRDNLIGKRFGRLTVIRYAGNSKWECICDCGKNTTVNGYKLKTGNTLSCGCKRTELLKSIRKHSRPHTLESRQKMSDAKKGIPPRRDVLEKAWTEKKKSVRGGWNPENSCAKEWILVSPDGVQYRVKNLTNFIRKNADLFGICADENEIRKTAKLFAVLKWHLKKHDGKQTTCCGGWSIIIPNDDRRNSDKLKTE